MNCPGCENDNAPHLASCNKPVGNMRGSFDPSEVTKANQTLAGAASHNGQGWVSGNRPKIICLCGSTRFIEQFAIKTWELELQGYIVLGCTLLPSWYCPVRDHFAESLGVKDQRDNHHLQKIDLADEILVLNIGGYIGESTRREIEYATKTGKPINYLEPLPAPPSEADGPQEK